MSDQTDINMGGFQCIPWLFQNYDLCSSEQPKDRNRFKPDISGIENYIEKVAMEAGDLLIFNSLLHGIRPNLSKDKVRIAQYISMMPAVSDNKLLSNGELTLGK